MRPVSMPPLRIMTHRRSRNAAHDLVQLGPRQGHQVLVLGTCGQECGEPGPVGPSPALTRHGGPLSTCDGSSCIGTRPSRRSATVPWCRRWRPRNPHKPSPDIRRPRHRRIRSDGMVGEASETSDGHRRRTPGRCVHRASGCPARPLRIRRSGSPAPSATPAAARHADEAAAPRPDRHLRRKPAERRAPRPRKPPDEASPERPPCAGRCSPEQRHAPTWRPRTAAGSQAKATRSCFHPECEQGCRWPRRYSGQTTQARVSRANTTGRSAGTTPRFMRSASKPPPSRNRQAIRKACSQRASGTRQP